MQKKLYITTRGHLEWDEISQQYIAVSDEGYVYEGTLALASTPPTLEVTNWAFYNDGTESGSTIIGSVNTNPTLNTDTIYLVRFGLEETSGNSAKNQTAQLEYNHNGGGWNSVNGASSVVQSIDSSNLTDATDTTQRITSFTFDSSNEGVDDVNGLAGGATADLVSNGMEVLYAFQIIGTDVSNSDTIQLRIVQEDASLFDVYNQTDPSITVNEPTASLQTNIYRWRDDDGSESTATWLAAASTPYDMDLSAGNKQVRLRINLAEIGGASASSQTYKLEFRISAGAFNDLTAVSTGCKYYDSTNLTNNGNTTEQLAGAGTFLTPNGGQCEDGVVDAIVIPANNDLEAEFTVEFIKADLLDTDTVVFRLNGSVDGIIPTSVVTQATITNTYNYTRTLESVVDLVSELKRTVDLFRVLSEKVSTDDLIVRDTISAGIIYDRTLSSSVDVADNQGRQLTLLRLILSNLNVEDSLQRIVERVAVRLLSENLSVEDGVTRLSLLNRMLTASVDTIDIVDRYLLIDRIVVDDISIADFLSGEFGKAPILRVLLSEISLLDQLSQYQTLTRGLVSLLELQDTVVRAALFNRLMEDSLLASDSLSSIIEVVKSVLLVDSIDIQDSIKVDRMLERALVSSMTIIDSMVRELIVAGVEYDRILSDYVNVIAQVVVDLELVPREFIRVLGEQVDINDQILQELTGTVVRLILADIRKEEKIKTGISKLNILTGISKLNILTGVKEL